jgi:hypothetical protein
MIGVYGTWLDALPDNQQDGITAEALRTIVEFDLRASDGRTAAWLRP